MVSFSTAGPEGPAMAQIWPNGAFRAILVPLSGPQGRAAGCLGPKLTLSGPVLDVSQILEGHL